MRAVDSYNRVNGVHVSESPRLLEDILRKASTCLMLVYSMLMPLLIGMGLQRLLCTVRICDLLSFVFFTGLIMSDWIGVYSTAESIKAGVDLEMPYAITGCFFFDYLTITFRGPSVMRGKAVERCLSAEKLFPSDIDNRARKVSHGNKFNCHLGCSL